MESVITPADFYSDTPPERIIGTECEYNQQVIAQEYRYGYASIIASGVSELGLVAVDGFVQNGGKIHQDVEHIEFDSAESLGPREAAATDLGGVVFTAKVVDRSKIQHGNTYRFSGIQLGDVQTTSGYHKNFLIPFDFGDEKHEELLEDALVTFIASKRWADCGLITDTGYRSWQKFMGLGYDPTARELRTEGKKRWFRIQTEYGDDALAGSKGWVRLEDRAGDAGFSPTARFLDLATTSVMLRLLEHLDKIDHRKLTEVFLSSPYSNARTFANEGMGAKVQRQFGGEISALDIQKTFTELAYDLIESERVLLPKDERLAVRLWIDLLDRMSTINIDDAQYNGLENILDFAAFHHSILEYFDPGDLHSHNVDVMRYALAWQRINPKGEALKYWEQRPSKIVSPEYIQQFVDRPPKSTRANRRGRLIKKHGYRLIKASWSDLIGNDFHIPLPDPYYSR